MCSVMICQLGSSLLAQSVSSAATRQLSCDVSVQHSSVQLSSAQLSSAQLSSGQLRCYLKAQLQLVNSAVRSAATCQLSCTLLAEMKLVISAATCWLSCSLSARLCSVSLAVICLLNSNLLAQLQSISSLPLVQLLSAQFNLSGSSCWHQGTLHSTSLIHHHHQLRMTYAATDAC